MEGALYASRRESNDQSHPDINPVNYDDCGGLNKNCLYRLMYLNVGHQKIELFERIGD